MIQPVPVAVMTVVVSRGQSRHPDKRAIESAIVEAAAALANEGLNVEILDIPHLYDLRAGSDAIERLRSIEGPLVVASWIFPRAAHWLLDRLGIRGQVAATSFDEMAEDADASLEAGDSPASDELRVAQMYPREGREIYSLDMRAGTSQQLVAEVRRLADVLGSGDSVHWDSDSVHWVDGAAIPEATEGEQNAGIRRFEDGVTRRWYPVIDYSRCTNCMECIDFCLFGVYGVDGVETILVEQPDNCRKGCPACSRVCPAGAIMFPQHKAPAIAGAAVEGDEGFKIDLSLLFGAPDQTADPVAVAARERDEQLLLAGRAAVGLPTLRSRSRQVNGPKDELDQLIDQLDACDI